MNTEQRIQIMQDGLELEKRVFDIFVNVGWNARRDYKNGIDIALFLDDNKLVGFVETKLGAYPEVIRREKDIAECMLRKEGILFYLLFFNDNAYIYTSKGFIKLQDIPTPQNYEAILKSDTIEEGEIFKSSREKIDVSTKIDVEEKKTTELEKLMDAIKQLQSGQEALLKGQDCINKKLDLISQQLESISERIEVYQSLIEKQLERATSEEEIERIISSFSDEIVNNIKKTFQENYDSEEFEKEQNILKRIFTTSWDKMSIASKKYLVSAKLIYKKQVNLGNLVDYSGVCLLVTKALEQEMSKRFYTDYLVYLDKTISGGRSNLNLWPSSLVKEKYNRHTRSVENVVMSEHDFTLGSVSFVLCKKFERGLSQNKKNSDTSLIINYVNSELFAQPLSEIDAKKVISDIATEVDIIREKYRNPSAHKNELGISEAEECISYVVEVERVLLKILNYMKK